MQKEGNTIASDKVIGYMRDLEEIQPVKAKYHDDFRKDFELFRDYIKHEDALVSDRITWFVTLNSFLLGSLALGANLGLRKYIIRPNGSVYQFEYTDPSSTYLGFICILSFVGISISVTTYASVYSAHLSKQSIRRIWRRQFELLDRKKLELSALTYPYLSAGGPSNSQRGFPYPVVMPRVLGLVWLFIKVFCLCVVTERFARNWQPACMPSDLWSLLTCYVVAILIATIISSIRLEEIMPARPYSQDLRGVSLWRRLSPKWLLWQMWFLDSEEKTRDRSE
jgi:hypothetical protein